LLLFLDQIFMACLTIEKKLL